MWAVLVAPGNGMFKRKMNHSKRSRRPAWFFSFLRTRSVGRSFACVTLGIFLPSLLNGQATSIQIPSTTPLSVELLQHVPMKTGEPLQGRLLYPIYVENRIAIPAGTALRGNVIRLDADRSHRIHSRLRGDFTPFRIPVVQFDQLVLPDGTLQPIASNNAKDGVPVLRLSPPPGHDKGSFITRQIAQAKQRLKEVGALFTAPGRGDRLVQFVYTQLPYHPQRIDAGTTWTVELAQPLNLTEPLPENDNPPGITGKAEAGKGEQAAGQKPDAAGRPAGQAGEWRLRAYLQRTISSANEKPGDIFRLLLRNQSSTLIIFLWFPKGRSWLGRSRKRNGHVLLGARASFGSGFES